ncbi:MAG TPA: IS66 family transposase [Streptosporangiaceae bacterium]
MPGEADVPGGAGGQRGVAARLRAVVEAKDAENAALRAELAASLDHGRRLELRAAELERRLGMDSSNSGTPASKEPPGASERRRAERKARQSSERERRKDRRRGGQPGHPGAGPVRDPDPDERQTAGPPARCSRCGTALNGAPPADPGWAQVRDVRISRRVTEWLLPARACPCCGQVTAADAPPGLHPGTICYGPGINTAAVLLSGYGNVPAERAAHLIRMLLGMPVSPGFVDKASTRLDGKLQDAGSDEAMQAALAAEPVLGADETPVSVLAPAADPQTGEPETGSPHVLVIRAAGGKLTWLRALGSRRHEAITGILGFFTGFLICDGYEACPRLLPQLAGLQQCCQHIIRRSRAVTRLGPGGLQSWAADVIEILRDAHRLTGQARARDGPPDAEQPGKLRRRYDEAVASGIIHNRLRDRDGGGNHPGYVLGCWLRDHADQVWLFTREPAVDWTNNVSERGAKAARRHQAVSGYWHSQRTLARWCRIRSYLDSVTADGLSPLDAITAALAGKPWLPATPAAVSITA